jgi:maleylacetoacetate isomerase/maleylpyruvate isomerase
MILHDFPLSSASYRVRIALNLKGLDYERRNYVLRSGDQRSPEYLSINPAGLVPALQVDGLTLTQSLAIIEYLDERFPEPRLMSMDLAERANQRAMALTIACDIHPLNNLRVLQYLQHSAGLDEAGVNSWYSKWVMAGFQALEALLTDLPQTPFIGGQAPGIVDICLVPQLYNARRFKVDLAPYPRLVMFGDRALEHPAFSAAAPA